MLRLCAQISRRAVVHQYRVTIPCYNYGQYLVQCVNSTPDQLRFKLSQMMI
jgi:hypothetical protein